MQSELFEQREQESTKEKERAFGMLIPIRKESPTQRAMRRIRSLMNQGLALVVAFSSGKDSSTLANLVLNTAREMKEQGGAPTPILVVHSNTGVEQPEIEQLARSELGKMRDYAKAHGLELEVRIGQPTLSASFPVRVIGGRGLPSFPDSRADCSTDWKVAVNTRLIEQAYKDLTKRDDVRDVVVMTGVRQDESIARDLRIKKRGEVAEGVWENDGGKLRASPILDFTVDDVWEYLGYCAAGVEPSYSDFADVIRIYAAAGASSCVVVADIQSASNKAACGSRFGCWACSRVATDRSMDNLIASDLQRYSYLKPLAALRNFISETQYDWNRRQFVGRTVDEDGYINIGADTYSPEMVVELLRYTLTAQVESGVQIISYQQLVAIDARWSLYVGASVKNVILQWAPDGGTLQRCAFSFNNPARRKDAEGALCSGVRSPSTTRSFIPRSSGWASRKGRLSSCICWPKTEARRRHSCSSSTTSANMVEPVQSPGRTKLLAQSVY